MFASGGLEGRGSGEGRGTVGTMAATVRSVWCWTGDGKGECENDMFCLVLFIPGEYVERRFWIWFVDVGIGVRHERE